MDQIGVREEEKLLVLKYISGLSPYIHLDMEFLTIITIVEASHYTIKFEIKLKEKGCFLTKLIG